MSTPSNPAPVIDRGPATGFVAKFLDLIERIGNALPDPCSLFVIGAVAVLIISAVGASMGWEVQKPVTERVAVLDAAGAPVLNPDGTPQMKSEVRTQPIKPVSLLHGEGAYWTISNLVKNFVNFPPLGIVLVGLLGIGVAEKTGLIGALLKALMLITPAALLTPVMVFLGVNSSLASDAGYIVLPPIAAALYKSVGRSPVVGVAAVFAGVSAGFSANLLVGGTDATLAGFSDAAAKILDPSYSVVATCNWYFMAASVFILTAAGWAVTALIVEPRYAAKSAEDGGPQALSADDAAARVLTPAEKRGLTWGVVALIAVNAILFALILIPGAPLHGKAPDGKVRWVESVVPLLFFSFLSLGLAYGIAAGAIRSDRDLAKMMGRTMADMGPYIVMAFFAAQFVEFFRYSKLGEMLAIKGGEMLAASGVSPWLILVKFVFVTMILNLFIGSASAKYAILAPVFVPMFMAPGVNISPELTQAAYRVGDSATNIISPLNPYMVVILVLVQRLMPKAGLGTLIALMLPYSIVFAIAWTIMLIVWMLMGWDLGPGGPLVYTRG